ncbi:nucleoside hydrolase-like isoform X1 [Glandiceps talaboti]
MKVVIDTDAGVDDAEAILMALAQPDVEVVAITCVHGNTYVDQVCVNVLRTLQVCNRLDIPVFKGASLSLQGSDDRAHEYHGSDGLGDATDHKEVDTGLIQSEHAVNALIRYANEMKGELTLIAIGPLTNLALAIRMDPEFTTKLKNVVIMGGNIEGRGNCTSIGAEFNFFADADAAFAVLNHCTLPLSIIAWEVCMRHFNLPTFDWFMKWVNMPTEKAKFIKKIRQKHIDQERFKKLGHFRSCDTLAMAVALKPAIVLESEKKFAIVELNGSLTRGQMVVDWMGRLEKKENINIVLKLDRQVYLEMMEQAVK